MKSAASSQETSKILSGVSYFTGLDPRTLETISRSAFHHDYDPGQLVILEGEPASGLYVIQYGWLKVSKISIDGREQILQFLGNGDVFNAVSVFTGTPNSASVTALEATRIWIIGRDAMLQLLDTHHHLARLIIQDLADRVTHLISLVEDLSLRTVEARLARLLLEQSVEEKVHRKKWATQTEIAARLGTVPDVISRTLRKLSERGLIEIARNEIRILDRPELETIAMIEG
jgi:CRP/FNR family transcriptional regulator, dissimilatory nitrate respiration regulator